MPVLPIARSRPVRQAARADPGFETHRRDIRRRLLQLRCALRQPEFREPSPLLWQVVLAELHLHLEGSIDAETVLELDPSLNLADVQERFRFHDFAGFLKAYVWVNRQLRAPEHYALAARRCFQKLASQGIVYAEVTISVGVILWKEQSFDAIFSALAEEASRAPLQIRWVFDAVRQFGHEPA